MKEGAKPAVRQVISFEEDARHFVRWLDEEASLLIIDATIRLQRLYGMTRSVPYVERTSQLVLPSRGQNRAPLAERGARTGSG